MDDWYYDDNDDDETEEVAAVDDILDRWLHGEDVSDDEIWEEWDLKYADEEDADVDA